MLITNQTVVIGNPTISTDGEVGDIAIDDSTAIYRQDLFCQPCSDENEVLSMRCEVF